MKLHLGCSDDIRVGFENLDPTIDGWRFEAGLPYVDGTVDGITISHALMYVAYEDWPGVMAEFMRVLRSGGVVRITEDDVETPQSARYHEPWANAKTWTGPWMARKQLTDAGFVVHDCAATETHFVDDSLCITHREHKVPKYVFYIEGVKP